MIAILVVVMMIIMVVQGACNKDPMVQGQNWAEGAFLILRIPLNVGRTV